MSSRHEPLDGPDDFPTPPWPTRALMETIILPRRRLVGRTALEPCCGRGYMARTLQEYFDQVHASDIHDYGGGHRLADFLDHDLDMPRVDWIISNPPFNNAAAFINRALALQPEGVAFLVRLTFLEGIARYETIFSPNPPAIVAPFCERVPIYKGRLTATGDTATGYCWMIWMMGATSTQVVWIPKCRKALERVGDYEEVSR